MIRKRSYVLFLHDDLWQNVSPFACRQGAEGGSADVACHGPIPQAQFLEGLGARERVHALLQSAASDEEREVLISGYSRLVGGPEPLNPPEQEVSNTATCM